MKVLRQMGSGFIIGAVSLILVIGGISLALAETSSSTLPPTPSPIPTTFAVEFASPLPTQSVPTSIPTATPTIVINTQQATVCTPPTGWIAITFGTNDTLYSIAERYKTTVENLNTGNCLNNTVPAAGSILYVPPVPTVTVIPCGPPSSWIKAYTVKAGDNLFRISLLYRTTVARLQSANCMGSSTKINVGQVLWVPNVVTSTPAVTNTNTPLPATATSTRTFTVTPDFSTLTPTSTFIVTSSPIPTTVTPSITPLPSTSP
ncbi:MAG TPA: LysM peptidoglycan-binding domain-containing protein [Anaerolineales bacterium]|nr:LysM peptidoglycan-binding domain-containing protein [Anaerolineales bacterium]